MFYNEGHLTVSKANVAGSHIGTVGAGGEAYFSDILFAYILFPMAMDSYKIFRLNNSRIENCGINFGNLWAAKYVSLAYPSSSVIDTLDGMISHVHFDTQL